MGSSCRSCLRHSPRTEEHRPARWGREQRREDSQQLVELVTVVDDRTDGVVGAGATLIPLQAPAEGIPRLRDGIMQTSAGISDALARFEGLHVLVFGAPDMEATVISIAADGVVHGPITRVQRPGRPEPDATPVPFDFVEIDEQPGLRPKAASPR